jgi:hypothetical protein
VNCFLPGGQCENIVSAIGGLQSESVNRAIALALCPISAGCGC